MIADADTGYGNALNVVRTVREFGRLGVAAIQLKDQHTPKTCGHYAGKELSSVEEMCGKLRAARETLPEGDDRPLIIARMDASAVAGLEEAIARGQRYAAAGGYNRHLWDNAHDRCPQVWHTSCCAGAVYASCPRPRRVLLRRAAG